MSNQVLVDRGALQMALNVLERAGKNEVADELRNACSEYVALQSVRPPAEIDIELEREIFDLCKQFADPYPSWVVKHIAWLRHVFASRHTTTAPTKD